MKRHTHCQQCGRRKQQPKGTRLYADPLVYAEDPFCSRKCCEVAHGITEQPGDRGTTGLYRRMERRAVA